MYELFDQELLKMQQETGLKLGDTVLDVLTGKYHQVMVEYRRESSNKLTGVGLDNRRTISASGRSCETHKNPRFVLMNRPKPKVKKTVKVWVNVFDKFSVAYTDEVEADKSIEYGEKTLGLKTITRLCLNGEYEVEE